MFRGRGETRVELVGILAFKMLIGIGIVICFDFLTK